MDNQFLHLVSPTPPVLLVESPEDPRQEVDGVGDADQGVGAGVGLTSIVSVA